MTMPLATVNAAPPTGDSERHKNIITQTLKKKKKKKKKEEEEGEVPALGQRVVPWAGMVVEGRGLRSPPPYAAGLRGIRRP